MEVMNSRFVEVLDILLDCLTSHESLVIVAQSGGSFLKNMGCVGIHLKLNVLFASIGSYSILLSDAQESGNGESPLMVMMIGVTCVHVDSNHDIIEDFVFLATGFNHRMHL
jgi:hypothetical protein